MVYWIRKNGRIEGPFPPEQIRRRINLNLLGSLDEVSTDRQRWVHVRDTELWNPVRTMPETVELPVEEPGRLTRLRTSARQPYSASAPDAVAETEMPSASDECPPCPSDTEPKRPIDRRKMLVVAACCTACISVVSLLVVGALLVTSSKGRDEGGRRKQNETADLPTTAGFKSVRDKLAIIECKEGSGTGFLLEMDGKTYLVSNEHVLRSVETPRIRLLDGTAVTLGVFSVAGDGRDLARFEVLGTTREPLRQNTAMPNVGDFVAVYGNSLGKGVVTESKGFVQGVGPQALETNAEIVHGNSGSPVVDGAGKVLGVAAFMVRGDSGTDDWTLRNTRYDGNTRRFAVRLNSVTWKTIDRKKYERQVGALAELDTFWGYFVPFLVFDSNTGVIDSAKLNYTDLDSRGFKSSEHGFDDMMKTVAKTHAKCKKTFLRWEESNKGRSDFIDGLNRRIQNEAITQKDAETVLSNYDAETERRYQASKAAIRNMTLVRKEALALVRQYINGAHWDAPQIADGYPDGGRGSIAWYKGVLRQAGDLMDQKLKELNKAFKEIEGEDDED